MHPWVNFVSIFVKIGDIWDDQGKTRWMFHENQCVREMVIYSRNELHFFQLKFASSF